MNRTDLIQKVLDNINAKVYVEIGVAYAENFNKIHCSNKIGIDPSPAPNSIKRIPVWKSFLSNTSVKYYPTTSDIFFERKNYLFILNKIDVAFIDGLHQYKQVIRDVHNCLKHLKDNGIIILHDCNPETKEMQMVPGIQSKWTGDVWKSVVYLRSLESNINIFVIDCDTGMGIITKRKPEIKLSYSKEDIEKMDYEYFDKNRIKLLNLKNIDYLDGFLENFIKENR